MPNITTVNLTSGVPTGPAGAATVSTIDALMALINSNGQAIMSSSSPVVIASDQSSVPTRQKATTSAQTSVAGSASSVTILAGNANRFGATIFNNNTFTLYLLLKHAGTATTTTANTVALNPNAYYEVPFGYTDDVIGIWSSAGSGNASVTEFTA